MEGLNLNKLTEQEARDKNVDEYNKNADPYDKWC